MIQIGITGGIGTGKSTVCKIFEVLKIPIYYADDRAKWLMEHHDRLKTSLSEAFGAEVYTPEGRLNRGYLSKIVFQNAEKLAVLNGIVHPIVFEDGLEWAQMQMDKNIPYTLKEAALLFESGSYKWLDKIIVVTAPLELRIDRVVQRDKISRAEVLDRVARQMPEEEKLARADFVIHNDGSQSLIQQVLAIHKAFIKELNSR